MKLVRIVPILVLACLPLTARQDTAVAAASPQIRGVVLEPGINLPIAGAEVVLLAQEPGPVRINGGWKADGRKTTTDERGLFTLSLDKAGAYRVDVKKDGYLSAGIFSGPPDYAEVKLTAENPTADVKLFLARPGRLTGIVLNEDTGKPIANVRVHPVQKWRSGTLLPTAGSPTNTDAEGHFVIGNLPPGEYAVAIGSLPAEDQRVLTTFTDKDIKATDVDYELTYWPGGHGQDAAIPVTVPSGGTMDIGALRVKKGPYYRVHVRIPVSNCEGADTMSIAETATHFSLTTQAPCGKDVLVTGYSPGTYRLMLGTNSPTLETRGTASVPFSILDKNIEIYAPLYRGVAVNGEVVAPGGARLPDFAKVVIFLRAVDGYGDAQISASPDSKGKFQFTNKGLLDQRVLVRGLGPGNYLKEIRYNGRKVAGDTVSLDAGVITHSLTIVVGDDPGTILGTVKNGEQPVGNAYIIAMRWPHGKDYSTSDVAMAKSDNAGNFRLTGLAPGEYRIGAALVGSATPTNAEIERGMANSGKRIDVGANQIQNLTLAPIDLR